MTGPHRCSRRELLAALLGVGAGCSTDGTSTTNTPTTTATVPAIEESTDRPPSTTATPPTTTDTQTTAAPTATESGHLHDVPFRETAERTLKLDLYLPATGGPHPFVVYAHGGAWIMGDKGYRPMFDRLVERGFAVADIQYRLAQEKQYPAAVRDVLAAVKWLRANAATYGIDSERGALMGYSAGAHLTALVAVAPAHENFQPAEFHPDVPVGVDALVGYSGPYDFVGNRMGESGIVAEFFGADATTERLREGSPVTHVDGSDPPALLIHGTDDGIVPYSSTTAMAEAYREAGVTVEVLTGEGAGHGMIDDPSWREETLPTQEAFLAEHLDTK